MSTPFGHSAHVSIIKGKTTKCITKSALAKRSRRRTSYILQRRFRIRCRLAERLKRAFDIVRPYPAHIIIHFDVPEALHNQCSVSAVFGPKRDMKNVVKAANIIYFTLVFEH